MFRIGPSCLCGTAGWGAIWVDHGVLSIGDAIDDVGLGVIAVVLEGWIFAEVAGPGIDGLTGWVDRAGEDAADSAGADGAWGAHPDDAADLVVILEEVALEDVAGVDEDNNLVEFLLDHSDHVDFVLGEFEVMLIGSLFGLRGAAIAAIVSLVMVASVEGLAVSAFGAAAGQDDDGRVVVFVEAGLNIIGVFG